MFQLNIILSRPDVVDWLQAIPADKLPQAVENTLAAGNLVLTLLQASTGEDSMQRFFRPVLEPMDKLKNTLDGILRATQKSQRIGELGEEIVVEQLRSAFPGDDFQVVSMKEHQADIHAHFALSKGGFQKVLIEVKFYASDVPRQEIDKFRRDLGKTGFSFGLMVSLTSRLTGITGPIRLEEGADYLAIYVPSAGVDGYRLLCAAAMLKAIVSHQARTNTALIRTDAIEQAWERLNAELKEVQNVVVDVQEMKDSLQTAQQSLACAFGKLTEKAISIGWRLRHALERVTNQLAGELLALPRTTESIVLLPPAQPDALLAFLEGLRNANDPRLRAFEALFDVCQRWGIVATSNGEQWQLQQNGRLVAWTGGTCGRLDVCVPVDFEVTPQVLIEPRTEKIKSDHVLISGREVAEMVGRLEHWLALNGATTDGPPG